MDVLEDSVPRVFVEALPVPVEVKVAVDPRRNSNVNEAVRVGRLGVAPPAAAAASVELRREVGGDRELGREDV